MSIAARALLGLAILAGGCGSASQSVPGTHAITTTDLDGLSFGHTTPADIEHLLGEPDARESDGALVYRNATVRGPRGAGDPETMTFRFESGVLAKVCRTRP